MGKDVLMNIAKKEPVALAGLLIALVTVVTSFVPVTDAQQSALILLATAIGGYFARQNVTPYEGSSNE